MDRPTKKNSTTEIAVVNIKSYFGTDPHANQHANKDIKKNPMDLSINQLGSEFSRLSI